MCSVCAPFLNEITIQICRRRKNEKTSKRLYLLFVCLFWHYFLPFCLSSFLSLLLSFPLLIWVCNVYGYLVEHDVKTVFGSKTNDTNIVDNTTLTTNACMRMPHNKYIFVLTTPMNTSAIVVTAAFASIRNRPMHVITFMRLLPSSLVVVLLLRLRVLLLIPPSLPSHKCICKHIGTDIVDAVAIATAVYSNGSFNTYYRYGPHFEDIPAIGNVTNITVPIGNAVYLNCRISLLQDKTVRILNVPWFVTILWFVFALKLFHSILAWLGFSFACMRECIASNKPLPDSLFILLIPFRYFHRAFSRLTTFCV